MFRRICIIIGIATIGSLGYTFVAHAQQTSQTPLTISPAMTEWIVAPGETIQKTIIVTNNSDAPFPVSAAAKGFELQQPAPKNNVAVFDASQWFTITEPDFIIQPHTSHTTTITLRAPLNASVGGHYATLYFRQLSPATTSQGATAIGQVGAHMLIIVKGQLNAALSADGPIKYQTKNGTHTLSLTLRNTGNVHLLPVGSILVKDWSGREHNLPLDRGIILPYTSRTYTVEFPDPPAFGWFVATASVTYNRAWVPPTSTKAMIWVIPAWHLLGGGVAVALIAWWLYHYRRRVRRAFRVLFTDS